MFFAVGWCGEKSCAQPLKVENAFLRRVDGAVSMNLRPVMDGGLVGSLAVDPDALFPNFAGSSSAKYVEPAL